VDTFQLKDPEAFTRIFLEQTLQHGFQSLGKRDLELLIFYLLERDGAVSRTLPNYEIAKLLRVPESRLRLLRKDSYARWQAIDGVNQADIIKGIFVECFSQEKIKQSLNHLSSADKKDGFIAVRIDHPADRVEFENEIINANGIPKYERNREVLLVRFDILLEIAKKYEILADQNQIANDLRKIGKKSTTLAELLAKDISELSFPDFRSALSDTLIKLITKTVEAEGVQIYDFLKCIIPK
jgi:hypothetical protein